MSDAAGAQPQDPTDRARAARKQIFVEALRITGNVSESARRAKIDRKLAYTWRRDDPDFADDWADAENQAADALEAEARRRAVEGWDEPVYRGDGEKPAGTIRKYSDRLLEILLKGHKPQFAQARMVVAGDPNAPLELNLSVEERAARVAAILDAARKRGTQPVADDVRGSAATDLGPATGPADGSAEE